MNCENNLKLQLSSIFFLKLEMTMIPWFEMWRGTIQLVLESSSAFSNWCAFVCTYLRLRCASQKTPEGSRVLVKTRLNFLRPLKTKILHSKSGLECIFTPKTQSFWVKMQGLRRISGRFSAPVKLFPSTIRTKVSLSSPISKKRYQTIIASKSFHNSSSTSNKKAFRA